MERTGRPEPETTDQMTTQTDLEPMTIKANLQANSGNHLILAFPRHLALISGVSIARIGPRKTTLTYTDGTKESARTTPAILEMDVESPDAFRIVSEIQSKRATI
jgi:hypothetical protein